MARESEPRRDKELQSYDVIIVGAGFAGLYALNKLRREGVSVRVLEAADNVGGVWHWNRYPGARCDVESLEYNIHFSDEIVQEWNWTERYAGRDELTGYFDFVAEKLDLRKDIQLNTRVTAMTFDEGEGRWTLETDTGERFSAQNCIMATGALSAAHLPEIPGRDSFAGDTYHTANWPIGGVDLTGKRVAVIGTGSSGVQSIPLIAEQASQLYVFQRTPGYVLPANNRPLTSDEVDTAKRDFAQLRKVAHQTYGGTLADFNNRSAHDMTPEERTSELEKRYTEGGFCYLMAFSDLLLDRTANEYAADYVRNRMRELVDDKELAEALIPYDYPIGVKRLCLDTDYLQTFNRGNVALVDLRRTPLDRIDATGLQCGGTHYDVDVIVYATGFDAMTGPLRRIDIRGIGGVSLRDKWAAGPRTYLGAMVEGFPNMFSIAGPGSPSVLTNVPVAIEQHVDWAVNAILYMRDNAVQSIEATAEAEEEWVRHANEVAHMTLYPQANSWYMGANVEGKPRVFMLYAGGLLPFRQKCEEAAAQGYRGFHLVPAKDKVLS